jgi:hypothetical protein
VEEEVITTPLVYPNPFDQEIFLGESLVGKPVELALYNILGQSVSLEKQGENFKVNPSLSPGLYLLTIQHGSYSKTVRMIKK